MTNLYIFKNVLLLVVLLLVTGDIEVVKGEDTFLRQRVTNLENNLAITDQIVGSHSSRLTKLESQERKLEKEINATRSRVNTLEYNVNLLFSTTNGQSAALSDVRFVVEGVQLNITHLENVNKIWKSNFRVLNRTVSQLRNANRLSGK